MQVSRKVPTRYGLTSGYTRAYRVGVHNDQRLRPRPASGHRPSRLRSPPRLGPMLGQHGHFRLYAPEKIQYAIDRYRTEALRLYGVLNQRLEEREFISTDYSIADMACWPWVITYKSQGIDLGTFPNVRRWYDALKERPGLRRGYDVGQSLRKTTFSGPNSSAQPERMNQADET